MAGPLSSSWEQRPGLFRLYAHRSGSLIGLVARLGLLYIGRLGTLRGGLADGHRLPVVQGRRADLAEQEQVEEMHRAQDQQDQAHLGG